MPGPMTGMPTEGRSRNEVFASLEAFRAKDVDWRDGRTWAYVYDAGEAATEVCKRAYAMYISENGLDPTAFPSALVLENEVVGMTAAHLNAPEGAVGTFTSGGTESIFLAVKAARERFADLKPGHTPRMVLPVTAHAAFHKAAFYMGVELDVVAVDESFRAVPGLMRAAVTEDTCLLVGSAVSYAHGVCDPIPELGALAEELGLPLHVDACIGGFVLPYFRRFGSQHPDFDFSVPGVTTISCDLHKYAFTAKGASVLLCRDRAYRRNHYYACSKWSGYTIINTTVQSTKSAGPLAAAWAVMNFLGDSGYEALMRRMYEATQAVCEGIDAIPELTLLARPDTNLVAFGSDEVDVFHVADEMKIRGWYVQPQLGFEGSPRNIHLSVNPKAERWVEAMLEDLRASVEAAKALPSGQAAMMVQQAFAGLDPSSFTDETFGMLLGAAGLNGVELPERMAAINEMLDTLPAEVREQVLMHFLNALYVAA